MPKELPKDALFLAPPFRAEKRSAQASVHRLRLFVSLGPFIRGKIRRELYHLYEHVLPRVFVYLPPFIS